jgi:hypothetical protein
MQAKLRRNEKSNYFHTVNIRRFLLVAPDGYISCDLVCSFMYINKIRIQMLPTEDIIYRYRYKIQKQRGYLHYVSMYTIPTMLVQYTRRRYREAAFRMIRGKGRRVLRWITSKKTCSRKGKVSRYKGPSCIENPIFPRLSIINNWAK